jgi:hypothetical protein
VAKVVWGRAFDGAGPAEVIGFGGLGSLIVFYTKLDVSTTRIIRGRWWLCYGRLLIH